MSISTFAGSGEEGYADGEGTAASFSDPNGLALDADGNLFVADSDNCRIRKITPGGVVSTFAGSGEEGYADGEGTAASFFSPFGLALDADGNLFVADSDNRRIRKITPGGVVSTFAGSGEDGYADGEGTAASFSSPFGLALDADGNLFVADFYNHRIRKITPGGVVSTFAGGGEDGYADGEGTAASVFSPYGLALDADGNLFVADYENNRIRKVTPGGVVSTFAGSGEEGYADGEGTAATFTYPFGLVIDEAGNLIVSEVESLRKITPAGAVSTLACSAPGNIAGLAIDSAGDLMAAHIQSNCIKRIRLCAALVPASSLATHMESLLKDETFADITFVCCGERITAHRSVLVARSRYFRTMLLSGFQESQANAEVAVGDTTASAFRALLRFVYTDALQVDDGNVIEVMRKARELDLDRAFALCDCYCQENLAPSNAISWLVQANTHRLMRLRNLAMRYVKNHFRRIRMVAKDSLRLLLDDADLSIEVMSCI